MNDHRNLGKLHFINNEVDDEISIYWVMVSGSLEKKLWDVSVSFAKDFTASDRALGLLTSALENPAVRVVLELEDGRKLEGVVQNILDQADQGVIEIWRRRCNAERS